MKQQDLGGDRSAVAVEDREYPESWRFLIERYDYLGPKGGEGVQWLVYEPTAAGLRLVHVSKTMRQAALWIARGRRDEEPA
jgi:hypothetical protein